MTKKDYIKIAAVIAAAINRADLIELGILYEVAHCLCPVFKADNPNFDRNRFLTACGVA